MQTLQLERLLEAEGIEVCLLQTNASYRPRWLGNVRGVRALARLLPYLWRSWGLAGDVKVIHLMANSGWSWQLFAAPVIWLAWLRRTPVIVNYRGGEARDYLARSLRWVRPTLRKSAALVVPSGFLHHVFAEFDISSSIVPNIIDLDLFQPAEDAPAGDGFVLVITRNLEPIYGIETALQALSLVRETMPNVCLKIAGSGPQLAALEQLVKELKLERAVEFLGRLERTAVLDLYRSAHAMLNPTRVDNMPNSVLEALACGLPVISTNVGGVPYIVEDGETALLVDPDSPEQMGRAILTLAGDRDLQAHLKVRGRQAVAAYSWDKVRPQWLALYERLGAAQ